MGIIRKIDALKNDIQNKSIIIRNMNLWIGRKIENPDFIKEYLEKYSCKSVGIYGESIYTDNFIAELLKADIHIKYIVSSEWSVNNRGIEYKNKADDSVDAIIITNDMERTSEERMQLEALNVKIINMFDILYNK